MAVSPEERATLLQLLPVVERARIKSASLAPILERVAVLDLEGPEIRLGVTEKSFEAGQLADAKVKIRQLAQEYFGEGRLVVVEELSERKPTLADLYGHARRERRARLDEGVRTHPLVVAAQGVLGAELKEIVVPQELESQHISLV